jgi:co-chaperonin GroES (HSP10)
MEAKLRDGTLTPMHDWVLVEILEHLETPGGLALPQTAQVGLPRGRVVAAGPGRWEYGVFIETRLKPGQLVLLSVKPTEEPGCLSLNGFPIEVLGKPCGLFRESTILGTISPHGDNGRA